jgi:signal transduction histidine kinase
MRVLIADDELSARLITTKIVSSFGYEAVVFDNGKDALECLLGENPPRLAILDWMMPHYNGIDICQIVSQDAKVPLIYTILLTSRTEHNDLIKAFESGIHDFQSKPVKPDELRCRLHVGQRLIESDIRLNEFAENMEQLAEARAQQLIHADRLATLGTLSAGMAHEINNPLGFISGNAQTIEMMWRDIHPYLSSCKNEENSRKIQFAEEEMGPSIESIKSGVQRISDIISGLKTYARKDGNAKQCHAISINDSLNQALLLCNNMLKNRVSVIKKFGDISHIPCNAQRIEQVFVNLIGNAADALEEKKGEITITTEEESGYVTITIADNGPGIAPEMVDRIFDPFFTTKPVGKGTGLGLSISKGIIEDYGGILQVENLPEGGACFYISFPVPSP